MKLSRFNWHAKEVCNITCLIWHGNPSANVAFPCVSIPLREPRPDHLPEFACLAPPHCETKIKSGRIVSLPPQPGVKVQRKPGGKGRVPGQRVRHATCCATAKNPSAHTMTALTTRGPTLIGACRANLQQKAPETQWPPRPFECHASQDCDGPALSGIPTGCSTSQQVAPCIDRTSAIS